MTRSKSGKKRWVRTVVVGGALVALAVAGLLGYRALRGTDAVAVSYVTKQAAKTTLIASVSGTGNVVLGHTESVSPTIAGEVGGMAVKVGDAVVEGQLLFTIVNPQLDLTVSSATASYDEAKQSLEKAELSVLKAEQTLSQLKEQRAAQLSSGAEAASSMAVIVASSVAVADETVDSVSASRTLASFSTTTSVSEPLSTTSTLPATSSTTLAPTTTSSTPSPPSTTSTTIAATPPTTGGSTGATSSTVTALDIKIAAAQVESAEVAVTVSQTKVDSAAYELEQATTNAAARQVAAPMSGTVTAVNISEGDQWGSGGSGGTSSTSSSSSTSGTVAVVISDLDSFETTVLLGETDVVGVKAGDKVTLTFDAIPDLTLVGEVESVATSGTVSQGVVSYDVTITPGTGNESVKAGMTVTAEIITLSKADVLAVPNAAVKTDSSGGSSVQILTDGKPVSQTVEVGMASDAYTEITTGLTEGQAVVTQTVGGSTTNTTSGGSSGGILGTGSGFNGGPADGGPPPGFGGGG